MKSQNPLFSLGASGKFANLTIKKHGKSAVMHLATGREDAGTAHQLTCRDHLITVVLAWRNKLLSEVISDAWALQARKSTGEFTAYNSFVSAMLQASPLEANPLVVLSAVKKSSGAHEIAWGEIPDGEDTAETGLTTVQCSDDGKVWLSCGNYAIAASKSLTPIWATAYADAKYYQIFYGGIRRSGIIAIDSVPSSPNITATGGVKTTVGDFYLHTFSSVGNASFEVTGGSGDVEIIVIGGGGGGGRSDGAGGGGGSGGYIHIAAYPVSVDTYVIVVGAKGAGATSTVTGTSGGVSSFETLSAPGGGGGSGGTGFGQDGADGGSGGGGGYANDGTGYGGSSTQTTTNDGYANTGFGNDGGDGGPQSGVHGGGGGGGSGSAGVAGTSVKAGDGGDGKASSISGVSLYYAGGGGGGAVSGVAAPGGSSVGGDGAAGNVGAPGLPAVASTGSGGGGGGGNYGNGGNGSDGIVLVKYAK